MNFGPTEPTIEAPLSYYLKRHSQEWNAKQFAGVTEVEIDAIVRANAAKLFKIVI